MSKPGCPICGKPVDPTYRPFCSKRCADVDLQRWLAGVYAVPASEDESLPDKDQAED
ncbi:DNA gyrase inhibitor YacG [Phenylobacterium sp.]|uniref:DNA gyrase inhibitor YacG n=1 Tax=Phenylobacterium sp. TaxID=1871053 RepID=UPI003918BA9E